MNVFKKMYSILYPEEIERIQKVLNELLKETELKIEELEKELKVKKNNSKNLDMHIERLKKNVKKSLNNINSIRNNN